MMTCHNEGEEWGMDADEEQSQEARCPECGYTEADARMMMDHRLCSHYGKAPWSEAAGEVTHDDVP